MELAEMRERILSTPLAKRLPGEMQKRFAMILLWISDTVDVSREDRLFEQGAKDTDSGTLILEGMVRIITDGHGKKTIEAPDILGEVQLFTPEGVRTATVDVVVGGKILSFRWKELGLIAREFFSDEEMESLKRVIMDSAWTREKNLSEKINAAKG